MTATYVGSGSDDTDAIQAILDVDDIILEGDIIVRGQPGIRIPSDRMISAYGAVITQTPNLGGAGTAGRNRVFETIVGSSNIRFFGGTIIGHRDDVGGLQWDIGFRVDSATGVLVQDVTFLDFYTDGMTIGGNAPGSIDVTLRNIRIDNSKRNALSVVCGKTIRIERCTFENTNCSQGGTHVCTPFELNMPKCAIDFEPNVVADVIDDVRITDCIFQNNEGLGVFVQGKGFGEKYVIDGNKFLNNKDIGLAVNQVDKVVVCNNYVDGARIGMSFGANVKNLSVTDNEVKNTVSNGINIAGVLNPFFARNKMNGEKVAYVGLPTMNAVEGSVDIRPFE